jgi:pimeloyl-ACP methyl ester carboxylesterase
VAAREHLLESLCFKDDFSEMALANWMLADSEGFAIGEHSIHVQGHRMHYLRAGSGPDLLVLHGLLGAASCWKPCIRTLSAQSTVHAVDFLGVGRSDRVPQLDASLSGHATRLAAFMDAAGIASADLVATSHGGSVALQFAATFPERVRSLVLQAPANPFSDLAAPRIRFFSSQFGQRFARRIPFLPRPFLNLALGRMYADSRRILPGVLDNYLRSLSIPGTVEHVLNILGAWSRDMLSLQSLLSKVSAVPALLLWGSDDRAVSLDSAEKLTEVLENSRLVILPDTGHLPYEENPKAFCREVENFLLGQRHEAAKQIRQPGLHLV